MKSEMNVTAFSCLFFTFYQDCKSKDKKEGAETHTFYCLQLQTSLIAKMLHCKCISIAAKVYVVFVKLFGLKNKCINFNQLITSVQIIIKEDVSHDSSSYISLEAERKISYKRKVSPYYCTFKPIEISTLDRCSTIPVSNPFFSTDLIKYVTEFLLPYFPLWSAVAIAVRTNCKLLIATLL